MKILFYPFYLFRVSIFRSLLGILLPVLALTATSHAQSGKETKRSANRVDPIPKGAVHLVLRTPSEIKEVFYYGPPVAIPSVLQQPPNGLYRVEVNPKGDVAAVTILQSMGSTIDVWSMKLFVHWKAKPGPLRIVDIPVAYATTFKLIPPGFSRRTGQRP